MPSSKQKINLNFDVSDFKQELELWLPFPGDYPGSMILGYLLQSSLVQIFLPFKIIWPTVEQK